MFKPWVVDTTFLEYFPTHEKKRENSIKIRKLWNVVVKEFEESLLREKLHIVVLISLHFFTTVIMSCPQPSLVSSIVSITKTSLSLFWFLHNKKWPPPIKHEGTTKL